MFCKLHLVVTSHKLLILLGACQAYSCRLRICFWFSICPKIRRRQYWLCSWNLQLNLRTHFMDSLVYDGLPAESLELPMRHFRSVQTTSLPSDWQAQDLQPSFHRLFASQSFFSLRTGIKTWANMKQGGLSHQHMNDHSPHVHSPWNRLLHPLPQQRRQSRSRNACPVLQCWNKQNFVKQQLRHK